MKKSLLILFSFIFFGISASFANNVTVGEDADQESTYLPIAISNSSASSSYNAPFSISQQLYFASDLEDASSKKITAITFYYTSGPNFTGDNARKIRLWINHTDSTSFANGSTKMVPVGTKVFSSDAVEITSGSPYTLTFNTPFVWNGTSNIVVTVFDSTGVRNTSATKGQTKMLKTTGVGRFLHKTSSNWTFEHWDTSNMTTTSPITSSDRGYVNKITFTFEGAAELPATPTNFAVSETTTSSATLSWSASLGATSYNLEQSTDGSTWTALSSNETGTSYTWTGLSAASTQYARICAVNAAGSSDWSETLTVTADPVIEYKGILFDKWKETNALPTSGNYYLPDNLLFDIYATNAVLDGDLNLCLNGKTATLAGTGIIVPNGKTLTIYDNVGGGKITSFCPSQAGDYVRSGLITVNEGGTLVLNEGAIENTYNPDEDGTSIAICCAAGTLQLSGAPSISSKAIDIFLGNSNDITIAGEISNNTPYKVYTNLTGDFTSGWNAYMDSAKPSDYFVSANASYGVTRNGNEARMVRALSWNEASSNGSIGDNSGQIVNVSMIRSLTNAQYNTFCLPFALDNAQLEEFFGAGYDLEELASTIINGDELVLTFNKVTALEAGKPYLLQPTVNVANPSFEGVTITATAPVDVTTTYIDFKGVYSPTELTGGNKNLLFLGADNELFWPEATGNLKGFRAYFEVKGSAAKAAKRARIAKQENTATGIEETNGQLPIANSRKVVRNGQLFIERDGKTYNALGQRVE